MEVSKADKFIIPGRMQIETIYGCNIRCRMCPFSLSKDPPRKKQTMSMETFKKIIDQMQPYTEHIKLLDLWGVGEPLLDPQICERIKYAKSKGFRNIAIASNIMLMTDKKQDDLLEAGIDSIILGIDGTTKSVHESLRVGTDFDKVLEYAQSIIDKRNKGDYKTRIILRFVKQAANVHQWEDYKAYWESKLNKEKGDMIIGYDVRPWYQEVSAKNVNYNENISKSPCHHVFDRLIVLVDGRVPMCCGDFNLGEYIMGNMNDTPLIDIFNCDEYKRIRKINLAGNKNQIDMCKNCALLFSESTQERWNDDNRWNYKDVLGLKHI
jgi:sulfatase maturation enzyme AslB (radical SAM superfamily)